MWKKGIGVIQVFVFLMSTVSVAATGIPEKKPENWGVEQGDDLPLIDDKKEEAVDDAQVKATVLLYDVAEYIDSFFDDGRFTEEENESRATLKLSVGYSRHDQIEIQPRLDVRLKLPKLSSRAQLILEAAEDSDFDDADSPTSYSSDNDEKGSEFRAALRWFVKESDTYNISVDAGASWNYLYGSMRFRSMQDYGSWQGRFTNRVRWYTDDGWENRTTYDLETQFNEDFFFRSTTKFNYYEDEDGFPHSQHFRLYQVVTAIQAISYEAAVYMETEPSYIMDDLQFIVKYRQRFYRDWLMLEISPRVSFPEDHDREINPGLFFKLEVSFGNNASEEGFKKIFN